MGSEGASTIASPMQPSAHFIGSPAATATASMTACSPPRPLPDLEEMHTDEYEPMVPTEPSADMPRSRADIDGSIARIKAEEIEEALSLLQTCATTASVKMISDKTHSDEYYKTQNEIMEKYWKDEMNSLVKRHELEMESRANADKARKEAERLLIVDKYAKKLKSFENKLKLAENAYRAKHVQILGALDESRRELLVVKKQGTIREEELRRELDAQEKVILKLSAQLKDRESDSKEKEKWRSVAVEMCSNIIELSCDATFIETVEEQCRRNKDVNYVDKAIVSKSFLYDLVVNSKVRISLCLIESGASLICCLLKRGY